ncbi:hypothetical protein BST81_18165 [Leptolyngbya sp. 'hensonii']|uniref:hypothetical protein n=1 Tax=Leptolyngbya sp. 'hensonii' TaxID=1922337 RepID=UPI00094F9F25|nr:hypothetical protein [Leptolyngbya sp. 'hensonii']OLP17028.1 hypothetical protein BST81_18165 [Leptolyngbya sp. 'hensonii']
MKTLFLSLGLGLGLTLACKSPALAVPPATVTQDSPVAWSQVVDSPFDGKVIYDKNFGDGFAFVSSWSMQGIRATYTRYWKEIEGYRTVWKSRKVRRGDREEWENYRQQEPIYRNYSSNRTPKAILMSINGQVYTYQEGPVSPELALALATAPPGNMRIRLVWDNDEVLETEIGSGTVAAFKVVFR